MIVFVKAKDWEGVVFATLAFAALRNFARTLGASSMFPTSSSLTLPAGTTLGVCSVEIDQIKLLQAPALSLSLINASERKALYLMGPGYGRPDHKCSFSELQSKLPFVFCIRSSSYACNPHNGLRRSRCDLPAKQNPCKKETYRF